MVLNKILDRCKETVIFVNSLAILQEIVQLKDLALQCLPLTHLALNHSDLPKGGVGEVEVLALWEEDNPSPLEGEGVEGEDID